MSTKMSLYARVEYKSESLVMRTTRTLQKPHPRGRMSQVARTGVIANLEEEQKNGLQSASPSVCLTLPVKGD
jgi:hypothetical protein